MLYCASSSNSPIRVGITAGGWVVEYLITARDGRLPDVGYVPAGLWGGIFLGRVLLAEPTHRFGERNMTMVYCVMILALQLVFWLVPNLVSSAVAISFLGFFFGPMFATGMSIGSRLFPKDIQPTALGMRPPCLSSFTLFKWAGPALEHKVY